LSAVVTLIGDVLRIPRILGPRGRNHW
jgi:hypothetical protein